MENSNYGECAKHRGQSMIDCSECEIENILRNSIIPKKTKNKISSYKPIMEINKENYIWIEHCVNKKCKYPSGLILNIEIRNQKVKVSLYKIDGGFPLNIGIGYSKHDINEAIRKVIDDYVIYNLKKSLFGK